MNKPKEKRFDLSKEERERVSKLKEGADFMKLAHDGFVDSMAIELKKAEKRLGLSEVKKGYERIINFDSNTYQLVVVEYNQEDIEQAKKEKEALKKLVN